MQNGARTHQHTNNSRPNTGTAQGRNQNPAFQPEHLTTRTQHTKRALTTLEYCIQELTSAIGKVERYIKQRIEKKREQKELKRQKEEQQKQSQERSFFRMR